jgi:hypothetical protein
MRLFISAVIAAGVFWFVPGMALATPAQAPGGAVEARDGHAPIMVNSYTRDRATSRLEKAGFTNIYGLIRSEDGIWRGKATLAGQTIAVSIDPEGNVAPR